MQLTVLFTQERSCRYRLNQYLEYVTYYFSKGGLLEIEYSAIHVMNFKLFERDRKMTSIISVHKILNDVKIERL